MKEAVDRILKVEEAARQKIEKVRQESADSVRKAQQQAAELIEQSVSDAQAEAESRRNQAHKEFAREKEKELKLTQDKISAKRLQREKDIPSLCDKVFSRIIQTKG
jgi:vacuolar-type H+-ATPase subunit H